MKDHIGFMERFKIDSLSEDAGDFSTGVVEVRVDACKGCALCVEACPANTLEMKEEKAQMAKGLPMCMSCGACTAICPEGAVRQVRFASFRHAFRYLDRDEPCFPRDFD